jgi:hypothetical protein
MQPSASSITVGIGICAIPSAICHCGCNLWWLWVLRRLVVLHHFLLWRTPNSNIGHILMGLRVYLAANAIIAIRLILLLKLNENFIREVSLRNFLVFLIF